MTAGIATCIYVYDRKTLKRKKRNKGKPATSLARVIRGGGGGVVIPRVTQTNLNVSYDSATPDFNYPSRAVYRAAYATTLHTSPAVIPAAIYRRLVSENASECSRVSARS